MKSGSHGSAWPAQSPWMSSWIMVFFFVCKAEDGIRDHCVTGVQTCALPISYKCDQEFTMNTDGSNVRLVSTGKGRTTCGYFTPDGKRIIYASTHLGSPDCPPIADKSQEIGRASCRERVTISVIAVSLKKKRR